MSKSAVQPRPRKSSKTKSKRGRQRLIAEARRLRKRKLTHEQIGRRLGVSRSTVATWLPRKQVQRADTISGKVLLQWIEEHSREEHRHGRLINETPISETLTRAIYRWEHDGVNPSLTKAEEALLQFGGVTCREFEQWAKEHDLCIWVGGAAPSWWDDESNSRLFEDLQSTDPMWRREARLEGIELGLLRKDGRPRVRPAAAVDQRQLVAA